MPMQKAIIPKLQGSKKSALNNALFLPHLFLNFDPQISFTPIGEEIIPGAAE